MNDYEKLGAFYLGRPHDVVSGITSKVPLLYDSRDLVTHAVCVGMTGSGKTGLCINMLEEAAIDGVPAIAIDPKGDLTNLLLTFPDLEPTDFRPWINEDDARRKHLSPDEYATLQATLWKDGLAKWDQDGDRIRHLREASEFNVYTPGSTAGIPVSILDSLAAPPAAVRDDAEAFGDRVSGTATSILGLAGIKVDPIRSREHILLSEILTEAWKQGADLDLGTLISQVQKPPMTRVGVVDVETFYSSEERFDLAMTLNNLAASPSFATWLQGAPLDIDQLLHTESGKPRIAIFSIAHLDESERMFFVSLLLNQTLSWMRSQPGTTSLRSILYMDEVFGYLPPVANPPSKRPLLTLLKQARAYGLGLVLATQNPVDLDYKALSNIGTWFIGRLQTERDRARLLEGLEGASAGADRKFDRQTMKETLARLGNRVFLMNNVHEDAPVTFETRWAMSYLRGPLTRSQIRMLTESPPEQPPPGTPEAKAIAKPLLPPDVRQFFAPVRSRRPPGAELLYVPMILGSAEIHVRNNSLGVETDEEVVLLATVRDEPDAVDWDASQSAPFAIADLTDAPEWDDAMYVDPPPAASRVRKYGAWEKDFVAWIYRKHTVSLLKSPSLTIVSQPGESEREFRIRIQQAGREFRDESLEKLREKYASKETTLRRRLEASQARVEREADQANQQKLQTAISFGATLLSAFMGRKRLSMSSISRATSTARGAGRILKETGDVGRAKTSVEEVKAELENLEAEFKKDTAELAAKSDPLTEELETIQLRPLKRDISVRLFGLVWTPHWRGADGETTSAI